MLFLKLIFIFNYIMYFNDLEMYIDINPIIIDKRLLTLNYISFKKGKSYIL